MKYLKNKKLMIGFSVMGLCVVSLFFTNARKRDKTLGSLINESNKIERLLKAKSDRSEASEGLLTAHQTKVANLIALRSKAQSCEELMKFDKNLKTGIYTLYPQNRRVGRPFFCKVTDQQVVEEVALDESEKKGRSQHTGLFRRPGSR